jgi:hypothetical protein
VNIDFGLVNRVLARIGEDPLTFSDRSGETLRFRTIKDYYLQTFLEGLSEVPWTGGRKREQLVRTGRPHIRAAGYRFMYDVPFDCARPIELRDNDYFIIEDRFLCTDQERAELLYITNGKILRTIAAVSMRPGDVVADMEYITAGRPENAPGLVLRMGRPGDIPAYTGSEARPLPEDPVLDEDYPDYRPPQYEPKFYEYIELVLAANLATPLTKSPQLHAQLLREALLIREGAVTASMGAAAAKLRPRKWWKEELGL